MISDDIDKDGNVGVEDVTEGIVVNGVRLNNNRYVDDTAFITTSQDGAQLVFQIA